MEKPVVYYYDNKDPDFTPFTITQFNGIEGDDFRVAYITIVLNHPRLGYCRNVRTSTIVKVTPDGTIETLNTIYKPTDDLEKFYE